MRIRFESANIYLHIFIYVFVTKLIKSEQKKRQMNPGVIDYGYLKHISVTSVYRYTVQFLLKTKYANR